MIVEFLETLFILNIAASIAIAVVLLTRKPVRKTFGARAAYIFWLVVPACTLATLLPAPRVTTETMAPLRFVTIDSVNQGTTTGQPSFKALSTDQAGIDITVADSSNFFVTSNSTWVFIVWLFGAMCAIAMVIRRQVEYLQHVGPLATERLAGLYILRSQTSNMTPGVIGLFRPSIVLPLNFEKIFNADERALIIAHEKIHIASGDVVVNYLIATSVCFCWFNPFIHIAALSIRQDQELACDSNVLARYPQARRTYAEALLKTQLSHGAWPMGCSWPPPSSHQLIDRIKLIGTTPVDPKRQQIGTIFTVSTALMGGIAGCISQPPAVAKTSAATAQLHEGDQSLPIDFTALQRHTHDHARDHDIAGVDLEEIAATLIVVPEDRDDYEIEITSSAKFPKPTITQRGKRQIVHGGLALRNNPCQTRFNGTMPAQLPGIGSFFASDVPQVIIRSPRDVNITTDGAVFATVGETRHSKLEASGCGDMQIAAASERLEVASYGFGDITIADMNAPVIASLMGLGDIKAGDLGGAVLEQIGVGAIMINNVNGKVNALLHGNGNITIGAIDGGASFALSGAKDFTVAEVKGPLEMGIHGSGNIHIESVDSSIASLAISGSGNVYLQDGHIDTFHIHLMGSGGAYFDGAAGSVTAEFESGAPDVFISSADNIYIQRSAFANGDIVVGGE